MSGVYYYVHWFAHLLMISIQTIAVPELLTHFTVFLQKQTRNLTHIFNAGSGHTNRQAPTTNRWYHFRCGIAAQDEPAGGHILFHGSAKGMLSIFGEFVNLRQQNH